MSDNVAELQQTNRQDKFKAKHSVTGSHIWTKDIDDDEEEGSKQPGEKLQKVWLHYFACGLCMMSMPLATAGLHEPLSCVQYDPSNISRFFPSFCEGLDRREGLFLPDFCWEPCELGQRRVLMLGCLALTVGLQGFVLLTQDQCDNWLMMAYHFDLSEFLALNANKPEEAGSSTGASSSWIRPVSNFKNMGAEMGKKHLAKNLMSSGENFTTPKLSKLSAMISRVMLLLAIAHMCENVVLTFSVGKVYFECAAVDEHPFMSTDNAMEPFVEFNSSTGVIRKTQPAVLKHGMLVSQCLAVMLMVWALFILQFRTQWMYFAYTNVKSHKELKSMIHQGKNKQGEKSWYTTALARQRKELKGTTLMQLQKVRLEPNGPEWDAKQFCDGTEYLHDDKEGQEVLLKFKPRIGQQPWVRFRTYRFWSMTFIVFSAWAFHVASGACWSCVQGIQVGRTASTYLVSNWVQLMGACGRHADVGQYSNLASFLMLAALAQQMMIFYCSEKRVGDSSHREERHEKVDDKTASRQQLLYPLIDLRKHVSINAKRYEEAGEELPEISSYTWVYIDNEDREHDVCCDDDNTVYEGGATGSKEKDSPAKRSSLVGQVANHMHIPSVPSRGNNQPDIMRDNREKWQRSSDPRKVKLLSVTLEQQKDWRRELTHRQGYNVPHVCIEYVRKDKEKCHQIVPPEFVAGSFHTNLSLGPKVAWEKMSAFQSAIAIMLGLSDIISYLVGGQGILTSCSDIDNKENCIYVGRNDELDNLLTFRHSIGIFAASTGTVLAFVAMMLIRFSSKESSFREALYDAGTLPCKIIFGICTLVKKVILALKADLFHKPKKKDDIETSVERPPVAPSETRPLVSGVSGHED